MLQSTFVGGIYNSQQLSFRQGASERVEGVCTGLYMTDDERTCNTAENSSAKSIRYDREDSSNGLNLHLTQHPVFNIN